MFIEYEIRAQSAHTAKDVKIMFPSAIQYKLISSQNITVFLLEGLSIFFFYFYFLEKLASFSMQV